MGMTIVGWFSFLLAGLLVGWLLADNDTSGYLNQRELFVYRTADGKIEHLSLKFTEEYAHILCVALADRSRTETEALKAAEAARIKEVIRAAGAEIKPHVREELYEQGLAEKPIVLSYGFEGPYPGKIYGDEWAQARYSVAEQPKKAPKDEWPWDREIRLEKERAAAAKKATKKPSKKPAGRGRSKSK